MMLSAAVFALTLSAGAGAAPTTERFPAAVEAGEAACAATEQVAALACRLHRRALWGVLQHLHSTEEGRRAVSAAAPNEAANPASPAAQILDAAGTLQAPERAALGRLYDTIVIRASLDEVPVLLSAPLYGHEVWRGGAEAAPPDTEHALKAGIGLCGHHGEAMVQALVRLGLRARLVQFWWRDDEGRPLNHVAAEVHHAGAWRLYDPTYAAIFVPADAGPGASVGDALTAAEARWTAFRVVASPHNASALNTVAAGLDPFAYLRRERVDVVSGGEGDVTLRSVDDGGVVRVEFDHRPNYVGDNLADGNPEGLTLRVEADPGLYRAVVDVAGVAGDCSEARLELGGRAFPVSAGRHTVDAVRNPAALRVRSKADVCYAVLSGLSLTPAERAATVRP